MRGRAFAMEGKNDFAKANFDRCVKVLDNTKYAYKAKLVRAQLEIDTIEHWRTSKTDLESILNVK